MAKKLLLSAAVALAVGGFSTMHTPPAQATGWGAHAPGATLGDRLRSHWERKRLRWQEKKARKWGMHRRAHVVAPAAPPPRYRPLK